MHGAIKPFWETKTLAEMSEAEWESLCDGCGRCCVVLIEDSDTGEIFETDVGCRLFDSRARRCRDYENRHDRVPDCVRLTPQNADALKWMPETCAYRRIANGEGLADWHPLVSGDPMSVGRAGVAVRPDLFEEAGVAEEDLEAHIMRRRIKARARL
ncbi:MAG: YcgN family cysteine cluster protein [Parvularculaceae bacterium]